MSRLTDAATIILLLVTFTSHADDRLIARIDGRGISYREIACDRERAARQPRWLNGKSVEAACRDAEQRQFEQVIAQSMLEAACGLEQCVLTDDAIAPFRPKILDDPNALETLAREGRRVPEAVRRVYRGEDLIAVYEEAIRPLNNNSSLEDFREEVAKYRSLEVVERYLAKDWIAMTRETFERKARTRAMRAFVRQRIEASAAAANRSVGQIADEYFQTVAANADLELLDKTYRLPAGREVFL